MAKNMKTLLAIGGTAALLGGLAAVLARHGIKKTAKDIEDVADGVELEIEVTPMDEDTGESDFVDAEGTAEEVPAAEEAPAAEAPAEDPKKEAPAPEA